jgi:hypothetical protein
MGHDFLLDFGKGFYTLVKTATVRGDPSLSLFLKPRRSGTAGKFALSVEVVAIIHVDRSEAVWSNSKAGLKGHEPSEWIQPVIESRFTARVRREKNLPIRFGGSMLYVMSALVVNFINRDRCKDGAYRWLECGQSRQQYNRSVLAPLKNAIDVGSANVGGVYSATSPKSLTKKARSRIRARRNFYRSS